MTVINTSVMSWTLTILQICSSYSKSYSDQGNLFQDETNILKKFHDFKSGNQSHYTELKQENYNLPVSLESPCLQEESGLEITPCTMYSEDHPSELSPSSLLHNTSYEQQSLLAQSQSKTKRQSIPRIMEKRLKYAGGHLEAKNIGPLENLIKRILKNEMHQCELIIAIDGTFERSRILDVLVDVPVLKQIVRMLSPEDLAHKVEWRSQSCQGTFLLLSDANALIDFGNKYRFQWAYKAKVVILGLNARALEAFSETIKGKKTEHIIGVVEDHNDQANIFMNLLFWGNGMKHITSWIEDKFSFDVELFPNKIRDLRGGIVKVIMFDWPPIMIIFKDSSGKVIGRYGRDVLVVETLSTIFNFSLVYVDIPLDWGQILPNGSFTGLVGYLERDEGHIGIANLYPSALDNRHIFQDYSSPISEDRVCFLARVDPPLPRWQNPSLPFQPSTWLALFVWFLLAGPILYFFAIASNQTKKEDHRYTSLLESCMVNVAIHFEHPLGVLPRGGGTQIFTIFLLIYSIIITTGYKANLTAFLTITRQPRSIETVEELYHSGVSVKGVPWYITALKHSENPYLRGLLDNFEVRYSFDDLRDELLAGKAITINSRMYLEASAALVKTKRGKPLVRFLKECMSSYAVGLGYPMNSPLKESVNKFLLRMFESGIVIKWFHQTNEFYWKIKEEEAEGKDFGGEEFYDSTEGVTPLGMSHMQGIFIVLGSGILFSIISFVFELLSY